MKKRINLFLILIFLIGDLEAWSLFGPKNYDDCVLENINSAQGQQAVVEIKKACYNKFKLVTNKKDFLLSSDNIKNITGIAGFNRDFKYFDYGKPLYLSGSVTNYNKDISITRIVIVLLNKKTNEKSFVDINFERNSNFDRGIMPNQQESFSIETSWNEPEYSWYIKEAYGYKVFE